MKTSPKIVRGPQLREILHSRGNYQDALAKQLGVTPRYLAGIECVERYLTLDSVDALAAQLGVAGRPLLGPSAK